MSRAMGCFRRTRKALKVAVAKEKGDMVCTDASRLDKV